MLALEDRWVWDSWYLHDGAHWHCWFLQAPKSLGRPELRHRNATLGHAVSGDLIDWHVSGTAFAPAPEPAWDDLAVWTGSTVRGDDGAWHCFYTGVGRAEDGKIQRIGHAVSRDLRSWARVGDGLCLDLTGEFAERYEAEWNGRWHDRAMRDPWVMREPGGDGWLMYFTARVPDREDVNDAGCIGFAVSPDLETWALRPPQFVGGWGELEVPQVFESGGTWYCLFSMSPRHQARSRRTSFGRGAHYLVAGHPRGPWRLAEGGALDTEAERYAARIVDHDGLKILGFRDGEPDRFGGYIMDPAPVYRRADGTLTLEG